MASRLKLTSITSSQIRWAVGGWSFFITENVILSENRSYLISSFGDDAYHLIYGMISTAAVASIGYGYMYKGVRKAAPFLWPRDCGVPLPRQVAGFLLHSMGFGIASQALPRLQMPVALVDEQTEPETGSTHKSSQAIAAPNESLGSNFKIRCPFDFTDRHIVNDNGIYGLERISRHAGLWSFAFLGLGAAAQVPSLPQACWLAMPTLVAFVGGEHSDSRYRRGMGGSLLPEHDACTSNVPFAAILLGRQSGGVTGALEDLVNEAKGLNFAVAVAVAAAIALRKRIF